MHGHKVHDVDQILLGVVDAVDEILVTKHLRYV